jgi:hypothetical protein
MATLTCAALTAIYYSAEGVFADGQKKSDYVAEVNAAKAIIENTTSTIKLIDNANKPRTARVYWSKLCNITVGDCEDTPIDECAITGQDADAACEDYTIEGCLHASFNVDEALYVGSNLNFNDVIADNMLLTMKALDEKVAQFIIAKVDSFSSANLHTTVGIGCPSVLPSNWAVTNIDPAYWTPDIMAYFLKVARINKFDNPFLLDGDNLYTQMFKAMSEAGNADGSGAKVKLMKMKYYEDMVNMAIVNPSTSKTFMINRGALAFKSYALWDGISMTNPKEHGAGKFKFSIASKNIPGLKYDVYTESVCSGPYEKHKFLLKTNLDVFNAPVGCNAGTGVLEFACAACPTS